MDTLDSKNAGCPFKGELTIAEPLRAEFAAFVVSWWMDNARMVAIAKTRRASR
ncbi:hypothetical protein [Paraburkholderia humisilvae]|uniref:hypothetical protein n=1 Tax=Paraburkholderia humisilvae TaxID=627669 RepID=UPI001583B9B2|nr:hypothetical protein [Paraburkholderia humisilvae]